MFHLYGGFSRGVSRFGNYTKVAIRDTKPNNWLSKKTKKKAIIVRTKKGIRVVDGSYILFPHNNVVLLKKRLTPEASEILGPIVRSFKKKKFLASIPGVL